MPGDSVAADKAYSNGPCREYLRRRSIRHTIPEKTDSQAARLDTGARALATSAIPATTWPSSAAAALYCYKRRIRLTT